MMSIPVLNYNCFSGQRTENYAVFSSQSVNLLQIVMVSPGTHLVKIMSPCSEPMNPS